MQQELFEFAYVHAAKQCGIAQDALFSELKARFPAAEFDTLFHTGIRAMELHHSSKSFATKVWAGILPYDKAQAFLVAQFPEFPEQVISNAFGAAYVQAR